MLFCIDGKESLCRVNMMSVHSLILLLLMIINEWICGASRLHVALAVVLLACDEESWSDVIAAAHSLE